MAILTELKDPRVRDVTVTYVEMTADLRYAKVHVSIMGDETQQQLSLRGLRNAAGFLQAKVAKRIDTRYTPKLEFYLDLGVKKSIEVARILREVLPPSEPEAGSEEGLPEEDLPEEGVSEEARADEEGDASAEPAPREAEHPPPSDRPPSAS